jgi:hypothetical protein
MESESSEMHVSMVEPEIVRQLRGLFEMGWSIRRIARELALGRATFVDTFAVDPQRRFRRDRSRDD